MGKQEKERRKMDEEITKKEEVMSMNDEGTRENEE